MNEKQNQNRDLDELPMMRDSSAPAKPFNPETFDVMDESTWPEDNQDFRLVRRKSKSKLYKFGQPTLWQRFVKALRVFFRLDKPSAD